MTVSTRTDVEAAAAHIPQYPMVYYVDRGEQLTREEVDALLAGNSMSVFESTYERYSDAAYESASKTAEEAWTEAYEAGHVATDWYELDDETQDEFRFLVADRDDTDLVKELTRGTPPMLMRTHLATDFSQLIADAPDGTWSGLKTFNDDTPEAEARRQARYDAVTNQLAAHGIDVADESARDAVRELVDNGPYDWHEGVDLDVIFYTEIEDAAPADDEGSRTTLTFTDPHVVLIDTMNGSGHDVTFAGTATKHLPPMVEGGLEHEAGVFVDDSENTRMSWDDVCGLYKPAFRTEVGRSVDSPVGA